MRAAFGVRRGLGALVAALLLVAACPGAVAATTPPTPLRIMTLGDSQTIGYGSQQDGYRTELGRLLTAAGVGYVWTSGAGYHNGWTAQDLRSGIDGWMAADKPDVVLLLVGTNNAAGTAPGMVAFEAAYKDLAARILASSPTVELYVALVPYSATPWAQAEVDVNIAVIHTAWTSARIHQVDLSLMPPCLLWDGVHPGQDGYDLLGRQWYRALAAVYGLPSTPPDPLRANARRPGYERAPTDGSC